MAAQSGRTYRLYISDGGDPETWYLFAGMREKSQSHSADTVDESGSEKDGFQHLLPDGRRSVSLSGSGVAKGGTALQRIKSAIGSAELVRLKAELEVGDDTEDVVGDFHIGSFELTGSYQDAVTFSASFQSAGPYEWGLTADLVTSDGNTIESLQTFDGDTLDTVETQESYTDV